MQIVEKIMRRLGYVPKKELDKNIAAYGRLEAQEKRANDLKHMVIVELASYKDKVNQLYDLYYKPFPEIGNVGADIVDRIYDGRSKKIDDLFKALVKKCEKCGHAKCVCEIDNIPDSDCYFRPKLLDEKSVEVNQELLYKQFKESMKKPDEFLCGYTGACGKRLNGQCYLFEPCEKYIPLSK